MSYLKHIKSLRVYEVKTDHGPDHPYLYNAKESTVRPTTREKMTNFFNHCGGYSTDEPIMTPLGEIRWEKEQAPLKVIEEPKKPVMVQTHNGEYTLKDLCLELGTTPPIARKLLRSKGKQSPEGGWKWENQKAAEPIKKILKKLL